MEEREEGITFGEIYHLVKKRIWVVLLAAAVVMALVLVVAAFALNPRSRYYSMTFSVASPTGPAQQYADGTPFYERSLISAEALRAAVAGSEELSSLDAEKMVKAGDISISAQKEAEESHPYLGTYTVRVKGSAFSGAGEAEAFFRAVADQAVRSLVASAEDLDYTLDGGVWDASSLEERLAMLSSLRTTITAGYDGWIARYSSAYSVAAGSARKTLGNYRAEAAGMFGDSTRASLEERCTQGGFGRITVSAESSAQAVEAAVSARRSELKEEYLLNQSVIDHFPENAESPATVAEYAVRNAAIAVQIENFVSMEEDDGSGMLTAKNVTAFSATLNDLYTSLSGAAQTLKAVVVSIYAENTWAAFASPSPAAEGGINLAFAGVASFAVAFVLAAIVVCVVGYPKYRAQRAAPPAQEASAQPSPPAEG